MDGVIDDVYDHRADVGIICLTDLTERIIRKLLEARELDFHELAAVSPCVYLRQGHPLASLPSLTEEDLDGYPYVAFEHDQGVASDFFEEYPMATLKKPRLLLLDEHTAALDPKTAAKVLEVTQRIVDEEHLTTLMITHNMKDAIAHGNRLIMMYDGKVVIDVSGEDKKKLTVPDLLALFSKASGSDEADDKLLLS